MENKRWIRWWSEVCVRQKIKFYSRYQFSLKNPHGYDIIFQRRFTKLCLVPIRVHYSRHAVSTKSHRFKIRCNFAKRVGHDFVSNEFLARFPCSRETLRESRNDRFDRWRFVFEIGSPGDEQSTTRCTGEKLSLRSYYDYMLPRNRDPVISCPYFLCNQVHFPR